MDDEKQGTFEEISEEYAAFVEKFKPRKTTDDCYTPANIYETVLGWASRRYGFDPGCAVRPFWPGADFRRFKYPPGCVVVDNPPFSILASIARWYGEAGIRYILFVPGLMCSHIDKGMNYVCCGGDGDLRQRGQGEHQLRNEHGGMHTGERTRPGAGAGGGGQSERQEAEEACA